MPLSDWMVTTLTRRVSVSVSCQLFCRPTGARRVSTGQQRTCGGFDVRESKRSGRLRSGRVIISYRIVVSLQMYMKKKPSIHVVSGPLQRMGAFNLSFVSQPIPSQTRPSTAASSASSEVQVGREALKRRICRIRIPIL